MMSFRRRLRPLAAAWLLFQAATLSALIPRDCCAAHESHAPQPCHKPAAATYCPMPAADGTPCPMHAEPEREPARCTMRGTCAGPMAQLFTLLAHQGTLPNPLTVSPDDALAATTSGTIEHLVRLFSPPDPPPPRA
jgi:hypothetical protein